MRPHDLPFAEHYQAQPCGTRAKYLIAGCRCRRCRLATHQYETDRAAARAAGDWNGLVPATRARKHLRRLRRAGVGRRSVSAACDVPTSKLSAIVAGQVLRIRARTERRILAVTAEAIGASALVDAAPTWRLVHALLEEGMSRGELARRLGRRRPRLQIGRSRVTVQTAVNVERIYWELMAAGPAGEEFRNPAIAAAGSTPRARSRLRAARRASTGRGTGTGPPRAR